MRRFWIALMVLTPLGLTGCEDGPDQPFGPAPDNARGTWNNGNSPAQTDPSKHCFDGGCVPSVSATNKQELCTGAQKAARWADMVKEKVTPPRWGAGLDMAGGDSWQGLTIEEAEKINCQSDDIGYPFGGGTAVNSWGDNGEVWFAYSVQTRKASFLTFWGGYLGGYDFKSRDGAHSYQVRIFTQVLKDGNPFQLDWNVPTRFDKEVNELGDAAVATYAPALEADDDCVGSRRCIVGNFGDVAYIYVPVVGWEIWVPNKNAQQPAPSIPNRLTIDLVKVLPFSEHANAFLKLDAEGPTAKTKDYPNCVLKFGETYGDFLQNCIEVSKDPNINEMEKNKLLGGIAHSREQFHFSTRGVGVDFFDNNLAPDAIIQDTDVPDPTDQAVEFTVDQSLMGRIVNDRFQNNPYAPDFTRDDHGAGLVYMEYARIVQAELNKYLAELNKKDPGHPHTLRNLGDPACLAPNVDPNQKPEPVYPDGCTGFEGFLTCAPTSGDPNLDKLSLPYDPQMYGTNQGGPTCAGPNPGMGSLGMKPGRPSASFCLDPSGPVLTGFKNCITGDLWTLSFDRALKVFGHGKLENMPYEVRDQRFFFRAYFQAMIKYMMVAGDPAKETVQGVHNAPLAMEDLHFDSAGGGQWETAAYIDRRFVDKQNTVVEFTITGDIKNGIFDSYQFEKAMYRGESLVYKAMIENKATDAPAKESTAKITNVFGSPALMNGWHGVGPMTSYACASADPPAAAVCGGQNPPLDEDGNTLKDEMGRPLLAPYKGAFFPTAFALTRNSVIKVTEPNNYLMAAWMTVPIWQNPYDSTSALVQEMTSFVPFELKQPGMGFSIPVNGQMDKFISTYHCDLSGRTISYATMWDYAIDADTKQVKGDGSIDLLAVDSGDFLGEVFLCQDSTDKSLLHAKMYTTTDSLIDWLNAHPNAFSECQIIIRYSPFGNYPDYISSLTNGVLVGITQGGGKGRVVDTTLWVPGQ